MTTASGRDILGIFLVGAAVATGNPALSELGMIGVILPVVIVLALAVLLAGNITFERLVNIMPWVAACYIAFIFLWYEQYKLFAYPGSVQLFTTITDWAGLHGYEKVMRIGVGTCEIIASLFILTPWVQGLGGLGALALMTGAISFHLFTPLGVDPYGDGGVLFKEACSVWISAVLVIYWRRQQIADIARRVGLPVPGFLAA